MIILVAVSIALRRAEWAENKELPMKTDCEIARSDSGSTAECQMQFPPKSYFSRETNSSSMFPGLLMLPATALKWVCS